MRKYRLLTAVLPAVALAACSSTGKPEPAAASKPFTGKAYLRQADLQGKDVQSIDDLLGVPALKRAEGKGEFRRYPFLACTLIVILYPDEKGEARVRQIDAAAKISGAPKPDLDQCLARGPAPQVPTS